MSFKLFRISYFVDLDIATGFSGVGWWTALATSPYDEDKFEEFVLNSTADIVKKRLDLGV